MLIDGVLNNWEKVQINGAICVVGDIFNDIKGRFKDGDNIRTSAVTGSTNFKQGLVIQTRNSKYLLGVPKRPSCFGCTFEFLGGQKPCQTCQVFAECQTVVCKNVREVYNE